MRVSSTIISAALIAACAGTASAALLFDNATAFETAPPTESFTATGSTPNTFMGDAYGLVPGATSITGFDIYPVNLSTTNFTGLKINIFVWGTVNTGAVSAATPAFSNLLGSFTLTTGTGAFNSGSFFPFEGSPVGSAPGITLGAPLAIPSNVIGLTFNYQGTTDGTNYSSINSLTSLIVLGAAPTVGTNILGGATGGYYRNANSETNGNFTSALRSVTGTNENLAVRIYGDVPAPGACALVGLGGLAFARRRRA